MNSRVKTLFGQVVLGLFFVFCFDLTRADELSWDKLKTPQIEIMASGSAQGEVISSYPSLLQSFLTQSLSWDPKKQPINSSDSGPYEPQLSDIYRSLSVEFDLSDKEHFRKAWFHLTPQLKVRGLFGVHDFAKPRPLVIVRMGIHGNVDEMFAERFLVKAIYEDLDCNVLVLENLTSHAFIASNNQFSFGGVEEGLHTFLILQYFKQKEFSFSHLMTTLHLVGISLGGQGTFVTALMDSVNQKQLKSIVNFCPLIQLPETFDYHSQASFKNLAFDFWNKHRMKMLIKKHPKEYANLKTWKSFFDFKPRFFDRVIQNLDQQNLPLLSTDILESQVKGLFWPEGFRQFLKSKQSFQQLNQFWSFFHGVKTPITIYTTPNDPLVINQLNSDLISQKKIPGDFSQTHVTALTKGVHCGLAPVYKWSEIVDLLKAGLDQ